jgi:glycogen(starch) synthase
MRVLFLSLGFLPEIGGIEILAGKFLPAMRQRGHEYLVVTSRNNPTLPEQTIYKGIPIHRFPFWQSLANVDELVLVTQQVAKLKRLFAPELIHLNGVGRDSFFHLVTAGAHAAPLLITLHGEWVAQADALVGSALRSADWVAGCSDSVLKVGQSLAPDIIPHSCVIYNAVEEAATAPESLPVDTQRVLCLGRMSQEKGFDLALAAFALLVKRFPRARLVFAGDGPTRRHLEQQATALGVEQVVEFLGWVSRDRLPDLINTCAVVVIPSRQESLPLVALEAGLMARPVVGTRVGGLPEIVLHQQSGLLVDKEDSAALAQAIVYLFEHPDSAAQMGQAARNRVQKKFNWEQHIDSYDLLYRKLVANGADHRLRSRFDRFGTDGH